MSIRRRGSFHVPVANPLPIGGGVAVVKLTEVRLSKKPRGREVLVDKSCAGLRARGGARGWVLGYQGEETLEKGGHVRRPWTTFGPWTPVPGYGVTLREARAKAAALAAHAPTFVRKSDTVRALVEKWLARRYPDNEPRAKKVRGILENHALPTIGALPIAAVTRSQLSALVAAARKPRRVEGELTAASGSVRRGGVAPARSLVRVLQQLFVFGVKEEYFGRDATEADSPASLLEEKDFALPPSVPRQRILDAEELALLFNAPDVDLPGLLAGTPYAGRLSLPVRSAIILGPHLGLRPSALLGLRWTAVDFEAGMARVAGGTRGTKVKHHEQGSAADFTVPLSTTSLAALRVLRGASEKPTSPWVFPSPPEAAHRSKVGHLSPDSYADACLRLTGPGGRLRLPGGQYRPHDARRVAASAMQRLGVKRLTIERVLGHSLGKVGDSYLQDPMLDERRAAHELVDQAWSAVRSGQPATVVRIARRS
jgi:integrase